MGHAEVARGCDRASKILKYDGLPENGKPVVQEFHPQTEIPIIGSFVSTLGDSGVELSALSSTSMYGDSVQKPKFTAKIILQDPNSADAF